MVLRSILNPFSIASMASTCLLHQAFMAHSVTKATPIHFINSNCVIWSLTNHMRSISHHWLLMWTHTHTRTHACMHTHTRIPTPWTKQFQETRYVPSLKIWSQQPQTIVNLRLQKYFPFSKLNHSKFTCYMIYGSFQQASGSQVVVLCNHFVNTTESL